MLSRMDGQSGSPWRRLARRQLHVDSLTWPEPFIRRSCLPNQGDNEEDMGSNRKRERRQSPSTGAPS